MNRTSRLASIDTTPMLTPDFSFFDVNRSLVKDKTSPSDSDSNADDNVDINDEIPCASVDDDEPADVTADCCEVYLVAPRDTKIILVPCRHQHFCASCAS